MKESMKKMFAVFIAFGLCLSFMVPNVSAQDVPPSGVPAAPNASEVTAKILGLQTFMADPRGISAEVVWIEPAN